MDIVDEDVVDVVLEYGGLAGSSVSPSISCKSKSCDNGMHILYCREISSRKDVQ